MVKQKDTKRKPKKEEVETVEMGATQVKLFESDSLVEVEAMINNFCREQAKKENFVEVQSIEVHPTGIINPETNCWVYLGVITYDVILSLEV